MKLKLILGLIMILAFSPFTLAQSVKITPKTVTYKRPKPLMDFKKTFKITYPKVSGLSPALNKKVEDSISYAKVFQLNVKEEINEIQWLEEASFDINYNKNGLLDISLMIEGSAAYPSGSTRYVVVDLKTGTQIKPSDVFVNLPALVAECKKAQEKEVQNAMVEIKKDNPEEDPKSLFENTDFKVADLKEFTISDEGITFLYDYGFPHVIQALQPDGRYFFSWKEMKPFIKRGGAFEKFIR